MRKSAQINIVQYILGLCKDNSFVKTLQAQFLIGSFFLIGKKTVYIFKQQDLCNLELKTKCCACAKLGSYKQLLAVMQCVIGDILK